MAIEIVGRSQWGARPPKFRQTISTPTPRLWLHHTADQNAGAAGMRNIQNYHMDSRGWSDIAYSFVVDGNDGTIYEGRGAGIAGGHTKGDNFESHAICVMGHFDNEHPSAATLEAVAQLHALGYEKGWWPRHITGGHRDAPLAATSCPGWNLYREIPAINDRIDQILEGDDMPDPRISDRQAQTLAEIDNAVEQMNSDGSFAAGAIKAVRNGWADVHHSDVARKGHTHSTSGTTDSWARGKIEELRNRLRWASRP